MSTDEQLTYTTKNCASFLRGHESIVLRLADQRIKYVYRININNDRRIEVENDGIELVQEDSEPLDQTTTIFRNLQDYISGVDRNSYAWEKMGQARMKGILSQHDPQNERHQLPIKRIRSNFHYPINLAYIKKLKSSHLEKTVTHKRATAFSAISAFPFLSHEKAVIELSLSYCWDSSAAWTGSISADTPRNHRKQSCQMESASGHKTRRLPAPHCCPTAWHDQTFP